MSESLQQFSGIAKYVLILLHRKQLSRIVTKLGQGVFLPNEKRGGKTEIDLNEECVYIIDKNVRNLCTSLFWQLIVT